MSVTKKNGKSYPFRFYMYNLNHLLFIHLPFVISQSIIKLNQLIIQPTNQSTNQSTNQPIN